MRNFVHYIPVATTIMAAIFGTAVLRRFLARPGGTHLAWWAGGIYVYGLGTLTEATTTLMGWSPGVFRAWYISGALLGGAPLAQGSVYFHLSKRVANVLTVLLVTYILVASYFVLQTPLDLTKVEPHRLSGAVMEWQWVRLFSPFVNLYAVVFLIGGAALSAWRYRRQQGSRNRFIGNTLIAVGAILPGIGGSFTRMGYVEALYVGKFIGLLLIWRGYQLCTLKG